MKDICYVRVPIRAVFIIDDRLIKLAEHCRKRFRDQKVPYTGNEGWGIPEERLTKPHFMLVKDDGLYLMSPFPRAGKEATDACLWEVPDKKRFVCYATQFRPDGPYALDGDDFAEIVPVPDHLEKGTRFYINITEENMTWQVMGRRATSPA